MYVNVGITLVGDALVHVVGRRAPPTPDAIAPHAVAEPLIVPSAPILYFSEVGSSEQAGVDEDAVADPPMTEFIPRLMPYPDESYPPDHTLPSTTVPFDSWVYPVALVTFPVPAPPVGHAVLDEPLTVSPLFTTTDVFDQTSPQTALLFCIAMSDWEKSAY